MTRDQIANIEAGPECDRAVAEACGIRCFMRGGPDSILNIPYGCYANSSLFQPSTDLNDACFAAEQFGLFDES